MRHLGREALLVTQRRVDAREQPVERRGQAGDLVVWVAEPGDFSTYTLRLVQNPKHDDPPAGFDPILSAVDFSFKVACPSDFDCRPARACPTEPLPQPEINYLAKDYASFRQLMLDRMTALMPEWKERNPADLGVALVELLAYVGDYLSYQQDAVATESYIGTARRRAADRPGSPSPRRTRSPACGGARRTGGRSPGCGRRSC